MTHILESFTFFLDSVMELNTLTDVTKLLSILALTVSLCYAFYKWFQPREFPPGPTGLPLIGYAPFLRKDAHLKLRDLGKKYGDIFSFYIGPQLIICINGYDVAKEILNHPKALARPQKSFEFIYGRGGFSGMNGEEWVEQRRFAMQSMRNLGLGKGLWETMIRESSSEYVQEIKSWNSLPTCPDNTLVFFFANSILSLLFGRLLDMDENKADIQTLRLCTSQLMQFITPIGVAVNVPVISQLMSLLHLRAYKKFFTLLKAYEDIFKKEVEKRLQSKEDLTKEDFIGYYLQELEKRRNDSKPHFFRKESLVGNLILLFIAGFDSTRESLNWMLLLLASHQDIQRKIHDEIDTVIGRDGTIYYDDKTKMPYTMSAIREMTRWVGISALLPPRYPLETFKFRGYTIPEGCHIVTNNWSIMHDTRYFSDPMKFKPERFLNENGANVSTLPGYTAFSYGSRNCPGEQVAMMTLYIYIVSMMQKFRVTATHGRKIDLEGKLGGTFQPKHQDLVFIER